MQIHKALYSVYSINANVDMQKFVQKDTKNKRKKRNFKRNLIDHSAFMPSNTLIPFDRIIWYD